MTAVNVISEDEGAPVSTIPGKMGKYLLVAMHEVGHAIMAMHLGYGIEAISIREFLDPGSVRGGRVSYLFNNATPPPPKHQALIQVAGSVATLMSGFEIGRCLEGCGPDHDRIRACGFEPADLYMEAGAILDKCRPQILSLYDRITLGQYMDVSDVVTWRDKNWPELAV